MCGRVNGPRNMISKRAAPGPCGAKDAAGTYIEAEEGKKKNNVSENWTELVKILSRGCVEATRAKRSNYRLHSRYTFSKGGLPSGHEVPKSLFNGYRIVS